MPRVLSNLLRANLSLMNSFRKKMPKVKEETIALRKERKRQKMTNVFTSEYTGEKPPHHWLDSKKIKILGHLYEKMRNNHRFNVKIDAKEKKIYAEKIKQLNEFQYAEILEEDLTYKQFLKNDEICKKQFELLPYELKEEIRIKTEKPDAKILFDESNNSYELYFEQWMRLYPPEFGKKLKFTFRLARILEETIQPNE